MVSLTQVGHTSLRVVRDGQGVSNHTSWHRAVVSAVEAARQGGTVEIVTDQRIRVSVNDHEPQPEIEPDAEPEIDSDPVPAPEGDAPRSRQDVEPLENYGGSAILRGDGTSLHLEGVSLTGIYGEEDNQTVNLSRFYATGNPGSTIRPKGHGDGWNVTDGIVVNDARTVVEPMHGDLIQAVHGSGDLTFERLRIEWTHSTDVNPHITSHVSFGGWSSGTVRLVRCELYGHGGHYWLYSHPDVDLSFIECVLPPQWERIYPRAGVTVRFVDCRDQYGNQVDTVRGL